jgi:hypothetical protein
MESDNHWILDHNAAPQKASRHIFKSQKATLNLQVLPLDG